MGLPLEARAYFIAVSGPGGCGETPILPPILWIDLWIAGLSGHF